MTTILDTIGKIGLVPVVMIEDISVAEDLADTLCRNNLEIIEITLRTEQGLEAIARIKARFPDMLVGAGTVLCLDQAKCAVRNGADFIVAPGFNSELVEWCIAEGITVIPGCVTPTEIEHALKYDLHILKYFPAKLYGGADGCKALSEPYRNVKFIPTGGINSSNLQEYVDKPFIHAIGGSWMCPKTKLAQRDFMEIGALVKESIDTLLGYRIEKYSMPEMSSMNVEEMIRQVSLKTGVRLCDDQIPCMQDGDLAKGEQLRLLIQTNSIERSRFYLDKMGWNSGIDSQKDAGRDSYVLNVDGRSESINVIFKQK